MIDLRKTQYLFSTQTNVGSISAGTTNASLGQVVFSNSNGVSFGLSGSTVTASFSGGGAADGLNRIAAGTQTAGTLATVVFSNSNGITFGMSNNSVVTASHNGLTTAMQSDAGSNFVNTSQSSLFLTTQSAQAVSAANGSSTFQTLSFADSNGISFSTGTQGVFASHNAITSQSNPNLTFYAVGNTTDNSSGAANATNISIRGAGIASIAATNGSVVVSVPSPNISIYAFGNTYDNSSAVANVSNLYINGAGAAQVAATNGSIAVSVSESIGLNTALTANGVSMTANSSGLSLNFPAFLTTAQPVGAYLTTARASNDAIGLNTAQTNVTWTVNSSGLSIDGRNYAGTVTAATNASVTLNSNGLSISVANPGGGGVGTVGSTFIPGGMDYAPNRVLSSSSLGQNSIYIYGAYIESNVTGSILRVPMFVTNSSSAASNGQKGLTVRFGIYTTNATNQTVLTLDQSSSYTIAASYSSNASWALSLITGVGNTTSYNSLTASSAGVNLSASLHGQRDILIPITKTLSAGSYWFAFHHSTSGAGTVGNVLNINQAVNTWQTFNQIGVSTNATRSGLLQDFGIGSYSTTSGAFPNGISITQINQFGLAPIFYLGNETV